MFNSAAHAHRILAILEAGDIMSPIKGYSCSSCSNRTLYKENFTELEADGTTSLVCKPCFENSQRDHKVDRARHVRETSFLIDSEGSSFLFGNAQAFLDANDARAYGGEELQSDPSDNFLAIFDDVNNITISQSLGEEDPINNADVVKETSYWLDSVWIESVDLLPQENYPSAESPREEYIEDAMFMLGEESLHEISPSLALMNNFMSIQRDPYTDVQKRELRLILKEIKKRGKA